MKNILLRFASFAAVIILFTGCSTSQQTTSIAYNGIDLDTVKAQRFDTGKMWTFDFPPLDYFEQTYNFRPSQQWLDDVRMSAIKFGNWCSSSFVSEDGLIMTNNHCSDFLIPQVQKEGEDIRKNGFIANTLEEERRVPNLSVSQLVSIEDVTKDIYDAFASGKTEEEIVKNKKDKIDEIKKNAADKTGLIYDVVTLYNGGKYSLYGYKKYTDIRLVLMPESQAGFFGGDYDNYTYPRYNLDCTFWRAYDEDGKPLKVKNYFKWSKNGAQPNEPIFVIGNPGNTNKLKTVAQLEYMRDYSYRINAFVVDGLQNILEEMIAEHPDKNYDYIDQLKGAANSNKRFTGVLRGLRNNYFMARKNDFERQFKSKVLADHKLKEKYSSMWDNIASTRNELRAIADELAGLNRSGRITSKHFTVADNLVKLAEQLKLPEEQRDEKYKGEALEQTIASIFPENFDADFEFKKLGFHSKFLALTLGASHSLYKKLYGSRVGNSAAEFALSNSEIKTKDGALALVQKGADAIYNSNDPFIYFLINSADRYDELQVLSKEITATEQVFEDQLGQALFEIYGTTIPPDGSFTLRIGDGVLQSYNYNGTIAPEITTFYGMYDRHHSFYKQYPFNLHERWINPSAEFDVSTTFNFISTHDIVGGSSGSAVINKNKEVVGLAFDGNIESNSGYFIYDTVENRMISVASQGMLEAIQDIYKATRVSEELINGKRME